MEQQTSFAEGEYARKKKTARREKFLAQMEAVVPWARLVEVIVPHCPAARARPGTGAQRRAPTLPSFPKTVGKCTRPGKATSGISG